MTTPSTSAETPEEGNLTDETSRNLSMQRVTDEWHATPERIGFGQFIFKYYNVARKDACASLERENAELKIEVERLQAGGPDYTPLSSEQVWKLIETYRRAGWYDDEFVLEIERQAEIIARLKMELVQSGSDNERLAETIKRYKTALEIIKVKALLKPTDERSCEIWTEAKSALSGTNE